jgi:hypothetical protein
VQNPLEDQARAAVAEVAEHTAPVTAPVEQAVETVTQYVQDPPPPPKDPLRDLGDKVKDAADKFRDHAGHKLEQLPRCELCPDTAARGDYVDDGYGRSDLPVIVPPTLTVGPASTPGADIDAVAHRSAKDRALADGMSRRGSPEPVAPSLPDLPNRPVPFPSAPAGVPTTGTHGSTGNPVDSHPHATLPWQRNGFDLVPGGLTTAADAATFGRPGTQPGVAPD